MTLESPPPPRIANILPGTITANAATVTVSRTLVIAEDV